MSEVYSRNMPHSVTYWAPAGSDGYGNMTFDEPMSFAGRWQDVAVLFRDTQGKEVTSSSVVYVSELIVTQGYLCLGEVFDADPRSVAGAKEIRQIARSPSLDDRLLLVKAML